MLHVFNTIEKEDKNCQYFNNIIMIIIMMIIMKIDMKKKNTSFNDTSFYDNVSSVAALIIKSTKLQC